jgi:hypothetical protein
MGDALLRGIDTGDREAGGPQAARGGAVAAAEIKHAPRPPAGDPVGEDPPHRRPKIGMSTGRLGRVPPIAGQIGADADDAARRG